MHVSLVLIHACRGIVDAILGWLRQRKILFFLVNSLLIAKVY